MLQRLDDSLPVPRYAHSWDAGADLAASEDLTLAPGERALVGTGIAIALPSGYAAFIHPRSGLALRHGLSVVNTPGTIDAGYRGEIKVCLINTDPRETIHLKRGDLIAQMVIQRVYQARFEIAEQLPSSDRGEGGYGSTGGIADWENESGDHTNASSEGEMK